MGPPATREAPNGKAELPLWAPHFINFEFWPFDKLRLIYLALLDVSRGRSGGALAGYDISVLTNSGSNWYSWNAAIFFST